jgi:hypothetical protein
MNPEEVFSEPPAGSSPDSTGAPDADSAQALRRRAEALVREKAGETPENPERSPEAARRALHELQVHQIELEMQNEGPRPGA